MVSEEGSAVREPNVPVVDSNGDFGDTAEWCWYVKSPVAPSVIGGIVVIDGTTYLAAGSITNGWNIRDVLIPVNDLELAGLASVAKQLIKEHKGNKK